MAGSIGASRPYSLASATTPTISMSAPPVMMLLAERILVREMLADHGFVDERHALRVQVVMLVEQAALAAARFPWC